jgi:hypothetical protein
VNLQLSSTDHLIRPQMGPLTRGTREGMGQANTAGCS